MLRAAAAFQCVRHTDVDGFAERALPWLMQAEAEHNLLLGIIEQLKQTRPSGLRAPYLATIEHDGQVTGCAFRTPPFKLGLTRMPHGAVPELVNDVADVYETIPAVIGPAAQARAFAEAWAACQGVTVKLGMRQRIYELRTVTWPEPAASGKLRLASRPDQGVVIKWLTEFTHEARLGPPDVHGFVESHITNKTLFLWEDEGEPRASALYSGKMPHGVRVGFVYTPPAFRRRGYASACVAAVSQRALDSGNDFCCLYTDLSNPTSNEIYQRIGYTPVCDVVDYELQ